MASRAGSSRPGHLNHLGRREKVGCRGGPEGEPQQSLLREHEELASRIERQAAGLGHRRLAEQLSRCSLDEQQLAGIRQAAHEQPVPRCQAADIVGRTVFFFPLLVDRFFFRGARVAAGDRRQSKFTFERSADVQDGGGVGARARVESQFLRAVQMPPTQTAPPTLRPSRSTQARPCVPSDTWLPR